MNHTTILIIGAGPVGLTLGCELARRNVPFRIIDRFAEPPQGSRAKALPTRSLEVLNDLGIAEELMAAGRVDLPFRRYFDGKFIGEQPRTVFPREDTRYPRPLLIPQFKVEEALRIKLKELGGTVEWATELVDFTQTEDGVTARLENPNWTEELTCRSMVACDGGKSATRKKLGIDFPGETHENEQLWVGDVELEGLEPDAWYNWMSSVYGLGFALFPFAHTNLWQVQAVMPPDDNGVVPTPTLEGFNQLFKERTGIENVTFTNSTWQSIYRVNVRRADKYRAGNAFIAGDAGHVHSIAGGMGMNTGIQDAYNLGWKLAAVINSGANASLLDTYGAERIPIADWLLQTTSQQQQVMMNAATSGKGGFDKLATADTTQLNLNYRDSSLNGKSQPTETGLQPGDRAPDAHLADGTWASDLLRGPEWKLLVFGDINAETDKFRNVKIVRNDDPALAKAYGLNEGLVLVRPDGYIALIAPKIDQVGIYFHHLTTGKLI